MRWEKWNLNSKVKQVYFSCHTGKYFSIQQKLTYYYLFIYENKMYLLNLVSQVNNVLEFILEKKTKNI